MFQTSVISLMILHRFIF